MSLRKGRVSTSGNRSRSAPLATLTADELASLRGARQVLAAKQLEHSLVERALASLWQAIKAKYDLPEDFECDLASGELHAAKPAETAKKGRK